MKMNLYDYQSEHQKKNDVENLCNKIDTKEYLQSDINVQTEVLKLMVEFISKNAKVGGNKETVKKETSDYIKKVLGILEHPNYEEFCVGETVNILYKDREQLKLGVENYIKNCNNNEKKNKRIKSPEKNVDLVISYCIQEIMQMKHLKNEVIIDLQNKIDQKSLTAKDSENLYWLCEKKIIEMAKNYRNVFSKKVQENPEIIYKKILDKFNDIFVIEEDEENKNKENKSENEHDMLQKINDINEMNNAQGLINSNSVNSISENLEGIKTLDIMDLIENPTYSNNDDNNALLWIYDNFLMFNDELLPKLYLALKSAKDYANGKSEKKAEVKNIVLELIRASNKITRNYELKDVLLDRAYRIYSLLDSINSVEFSNNLNNDRLEKNRFKDLQIGKNELDKIFEQLSANTSLSSENGIAMSAFYVNRAAKIIPAYLRATFILEKNGIFDKLYENPDIQYDELGLDNETLRQNMAQYDALAGILEINERRIKSKDVNEKGQALSNSVEKYKDVYDQKYGDFTRDITNVLINYSDKQLFYKKKNELISELIYIANEKNENKIINWGYVANDKNNDENMVLLGFDIQYMNLPLFLHVNKSFLKKQLQNITGNTILPLYQGNRDMDYFVVDDRRRINNGRFTTQIFYPLDKKRRKSLKKLNKNDNFIAHLNWLQNPKEVPKYFSQESPIFFDIETGKKVKRNLSNPDCNGNKGDR